MPFSYTRTVRFKDTDAAGVVYFANVLLMCHEACEESLAVSGINLKVFFSNPVVAVPIVHTCVFSPPMFCGDQLLIKQLLNSALVMNLKLFTIAMAADKVVTRHVCIEPISRTRQELPTEIIQWFQQWGV